MQWPTSGPSSPSPAPPPGPAPAAEGPPGAASSGWGAPGTTSQGAPPGGPPPAAAASSTALRSAAPFDSGLSTPDFVACLSMGLRPLGLVQGFYCGQISGWSNYTSERLVNYSCMHPEYHVNPGWVGHVYGLDDAWATAHATALERMMAEAANLGAHGVVGVTTEMSHPTNSQSCEVHLYGTAVAIEGAGAPRQPWSTQLAGHKLAKLVEIGFVPHSVAYARYTAVLSEGCIMEYYDSQFQSWSGETVVPVRDLHDAARSGAIKAAQGLAQHACMYDVRMQVHEAEHMKSSFVTCTLMGSLVRRVRATLPIARPLPTVRLS